MTLLTGLALSNIVPSPRGVPMTGHEARALSLPLRRLSPNEAFPPSLLILLDRGSTPACPSRVKDYITLDFLKTAISPCKAITNTSCLPMTFPQHGQTALPCLMVITSGESRLKGRLGPSPQDLISRRKRPE